jgi:hypothetical protein
MKAAYEVDYSKSKRNGLWMQTKRQFHQNWLTLGRAITHSHKQFRLRAFQWAYRCWKSDSKELVADETCLGRKCGQEWLHSESTIIPKSF